MHGMHACTTTYLAYLCYFFQASPGVIANPFAAGIVRKNSMESISSVDRDLSPEEIDIMQKVSSMHHTEQEQQRSGWKNNICLCDLSCRRWRWWERRPSGNGRRWKKWWVISSPTRLSYNRLLNNNKNMLSKWRPLPNLSYNYNWYMWICLFLSLFLLSYALFSLKPFWMILGAAHSKHHILFPLISFIKYVLLSSWSLVLLFLHDSASSKPHSHLCNGCHRNVCMCVHICVDKMCVCVWLGKLHPPPPPCLPSFGKGAYALGARGGNSFAGGGNWGEALCPTCLDGPH